jgi:hypothetical protein
MAAMPESCGVRSAAWTEIRALFAVGTLFLATVAQGADPKERGQTVDRFPSPGQSAGEAEFFYA